MNVQVRKARPDERPPRYEPKAGNAWSPQTKKTAGLLGWCIGLFMGWQLGIPAYVPEDQVESDLYSEMFQQHIEAAMNDQTDIREFLPPLTTADIRTEDKIQELERLLAYARKWYPKHAKAKGGVVEVKLPIKQSEAYSYIHIIKAILADYQHQVNGPKSYTETAERLGEKD